MLYSPYDFPRRIQRAQHAVPLQWIRGVQWGDAPLHFFLSPKIEDPPQEEWGIKGVEGLVH